MVSAILVSLFLLLTFKYLKDQKAQERRTATQRDLPREQLLPRHYKSFVEVENKLWAAVEQNTRPKWGAGAIRLRDAEVQLVQDYIRGLQQDFVQANRIFSVVIGRSPSAEILKQLERHRSKIELPYLALCAVVRLRLWTNRVSMQELRRLTELVASMAYEVRSMLNVFEQSGRFDFVETLLRKS